MEKTKRLTLIFDHLHLITFYFYAFFYRKQAPLTNIRSLSTIRKKGGYFMQKTTSIELVHFSEDYVECLHAFELPEEQHQFTALPKELTIEKVGQYPIVIVSDTVPVGFFVLHATERVQEYSSNPDAMLLTALSMDHRHQGKGYAKQAMLALADFVKQQFPTCNEVVLVVNQKNIPAQHLYRKVGFVDHGERRMGRIGEQIVMHLSL